MQLAILMGYIMLNRKFFDHFLWNEKRKFSRAEAWVDLIQLVSFTDNQSQLIRGVLVKWNRGQYPVSHSFLAKRWGWTVAQVRTYISTLRVEGQITTRSTSVTTILTLCNYDYYNTESQADNISEAQAEGQADRKRNAIIKEGKKVNNSKKEKEEEGLSYFSAYSDSTELFEKWKEWIAFRKLLKKPFKTRKGAEWNLKHLLKISNNDPLTAVEIIDQSMANEYYGLFPLKTNGKKNNGKATELQKVYEITHHLTDEYLEQSRQAALRKFNRVNN